jgi:hypothetical protein
VTDGSNRNSFENGSVCESQDGWNGWARKKRRQGQLSNKVAVAAPRQTDLQVRRNGRWTGGREIDRMNVEVGMRYGR